MWLVPVVLFVASQLVFSSGALLRADAKPLSLKMVGADSLEGSMDGCFHRSSKGRGRLPSNLEQCCFLSMTPLVFSPSKLLTVYIVLFTCEKKSGMETMIQYVNICQSMPEASWNIPETSYFGIHIQIPSSEFSRNLTETIATHWMVQCWTEVGGHRDGYAPHHFVSRIPPLSL